jgi:hypothetical protein
MWGHWEQREGYKDSSAPPSLLILHTSLPPSISSNFQVDQSMEFSSPSFSKKRLSDLDAFALFCSGGGDVGMPG